jgi:hypothetical protein
LDYEAASKINPRIVQPAFTWERRTQDTDAELIFGHRHHRRCCRSGKSGWPSYLAGHGLWIWGALSASWYCHSPLFPGENWEGAGNYHQPGFNRSLSTGTTFCYTLIDGILLKKGGRGTARGQFPYGVYTAKDGDVATLFGQDDEEWPVFCSILGIEHLLENPKYKTAKERTERKFELYPILDEAFKKKTREEWAELFKQSGLRVDPCLDYQEVLDHDQFKALDLVVDIEHPVREKIRALRPPIEFKGVPRPTTYRHPPILGEHTREILLEVGYKDQEVNEFSEQGIVGIPIPSMLKPARLEDKEKIIKRTPPSIDLGKG